MSQKSVNSSKIFNFQLSWKGCARTTLLKHLIETKFNAVSSKFQNIRAPKDTLRPSLELKFMKRILKINEKFLIFLVLTKDVRLVKEKRNLKICTAVRYYSLVKNKRVHLVVLKTQFRSNTFTSPCTKIPYSLDNSQEKVSWCVTQHSCLSLLP